MPTNEAAEVVAARAFVAGIAEMAVKAATEITLRRDELIFDTSRVSRFSVCASSCSERRHRCLEFTDGEKALHAAMMKRKDSVDFMIW